MKLKEIQMSVVSHAYWVVIQIEQNREGHWSECLGMFNTLEDATKYVDKVYPNRKSRGDYDDSICGSVQILEVPSMVSKRVEFSQFDEDEDEEEEDNKDEEDNLQ